MPTREIRPPLPTAARPDDDTERRRQTWERAYRARTAEDLVALYADWAADYDRDHRAIGFDGHRVAAAVLARHLTRRDRARVLDAGAGTGAAGEALRELGFSDLFAIDLSPAMLVQARAKQLYRGTLVADLSLPVDEFAQDTFDAAIAVGVYSFGQAPASTVDELVRLVRPGGVLVLTMRCDYARTDPQGVVAHLAGLLERGALELLESTEPLPYLPRIDPDATFQVHAYRVRATSPVEPDPAFEEAVREAFAAPGPVVELDHQWIWDSRGSLLYERYTRTSGYYLADCEERIVRDHAAELWDGEPLVVELGCGSARKIRHVLAAAAAQNAEAQLTYLPIDVSPGALQATCAAVERQFGSAVALEPHCGRFDAVLDEIPRQRRKLVFFFGSSIGNLPGLPETIDFLRDLRARLSPGDRLVLGIDLHKPEDVLQRAYNEEEACRQFFVHMVRRINEQVGADFDPRVFELSSTYEPEQPHRGIVAHRMNLRVAPLEPQRTWLRKLEQEVELGPGQALQVGISRKFEPDSIAALARCAGFELRRQWLDGRGWFSINELRPVAEPLA
jgi:L-histidine N-alpha-methyltransferase